MKAPNLGYQPVGFADDTPGRKEIAGLPVLGHTSHVGFLIREHDVQEAIIGLPEASQEKVLGLISQCEREMRPKTFSWLASSPSVSGRKPPYASFLMCFK